MVTAQLFSHWGPLWGQTPAAGHGAEDPAPTPLQGEQAGRRACEWELQATSGFFDQTRAEGPSGRLPVPPMVRATSRALDLELKVGGKNAT